MASRATSASSARQAPSPSQSGRPGEGRERVPPERRGQVLVDLVEGALDVDPGRGPPGGEAGPQPVDDLVEQRRDLAVALQERPGRLRRRRLDLGGEDEQLGMDARVLVEAELDLADVDGVHRLGQLGPQQLPGDEIGRREAGGVDGVDGGPDVQPGRPLSGVGVDGDVLDAVVVAVVAVQGGVGRTGLEERLPVTVGEVSSSRRGSVIPQLYPAPVNCTAAAERAGIDQSIGFRPAATSASLARENGRLPKNPLRADSGDGWADSMITWRDVSIRRLLLAGRRPPQDEHDPLRLAVHGLDDRVGETLPALSLVGGGLPGPHGEGGVEQEDALPGPAVEAAVVGAGHPDVAGQLDEDVLERRREGDAGADAEAQAVGLVGAVVRVLPEDQHLHLGVGRQVEGGEDLVGRRVDRPAGPLGGDELLELAEVRRIELRPQDGVPIGPGHRRERT